MTITTTDTVERYVGDGSQTAWPITFPFFKGEDVKACIVNGAGEQVNLVYGADYSVTKSTSSIGGTLQYALADGVELTIWLNLPITQPTDFYNTGPLNAEVLEDAFDRLTLIAQQLWEASGRSVKVGTSSTATPEELLVTLYAGRDAAVASASAAASSESNAAASKQAAATSVTNAAASASAAAGSAITAETWAESETPPDPNNAESKSAKTWALSAAANVPFASTTYAGKVMASSSLSVDQATGKATVPQVPLLEAFRISRIGVPSPVASTTIDDSFMWADGSLVLLADYPELQEKYVAGGLMVLDADSTAVQQAAKPLYFVANTEGTGLYLPRLNGLFARTWTGEDDGTAGGYNTAGLPNITGSVSSGRSGFYSGTGALSGTNNNGNSEGAFAAYGIGTLAFNASRANSIYGSSATVMPASWNQPYAVYLGKYIPTSSETE